MLTASTDTCWVSFGTLASWPIKVFDLLSAANFVFSVANVAQNLLLQNDVSSWNAANAMLQSLRDYDPTLTSHELNHPFVECATFADDIKYNGGAW